MNRITPTESKEIRIKEALAAVEFVGYENLSVTDREQVDRLLYVDDLTEAQWKKDREGIWKERLNHLDDIAANLGYKPSELYKQDVLDEVMKVRGEEYIAEFKRVAEKKATARRLSGRRMEYVRRGDALKDEIEKEPRVLSEFTGVKTEPMKKADIKPSAKELNAMLHTWGYKYANQR